MYLAEIEAKDLFEVKGEIIRIMEVLDPMRVWLGRELGLSRIRVPPWENIACHKSKARFGTLLQEGHLASRAFRDEAFSRSQVNFGPPNPTTDEKALWSKGKHVHCHTPCLPKVPRGRAKRSRATTGERVPHWKGDRRRPSQGTS
ncbi:hypothetical protein HAX54_005783 [Datura stramonium]|uniref:DUF8018 domain-containing protein n=1 Tax=Datura stramonium TaxID=4076 RepID=A0ABS8WVN9_DATST|nr:hypothetical protein [Datura stramonium]